MSLKYKNKHMSGILAPHIHDGYYSINLKIGGRKKTVGIHRIVAETFIQNSKNLPCVNHKDEDKLNNYVENLEWCTYSYNNSYGTAIERKSLSNSIPVIQMNLDGSFVERFPSCKIAAEKNNVPKSGISAVCRGIQNKAYGYKWRYEDDVMHEKSLNKRKKMIEDGVKNRKDASDKRAKPVLQYSVTGELIKEFPSAKDASLETGVPRDYIRHNCHGGARTAYGYIFKYK